MVPPKKTVKQIEIIKVEVELPKCLQIFSLNDLKKSAPKINRNGTMGSRYLRNFTSKFPQINKYGITQHRHKTVKRDS